MSMSATGNHEGCLVRLAGKLGLTSGAGLIALGTWWFVTGLFTLVFDGIGAEWVKDQIRGGAIVSGIGMAVLLLGRIHEALVQIAHRSESGVPEPPQRQR